MSEQEATLDGFADSGSKKRENEEWQESKLDNLLADLLTGSRPTGGGLEEGEYISIGGTQIASEGYLDLHDLVYIPEDYFEQVEETQLQKHDILVVKDGANTGDVAIAWESDDRIVTNEHLFTLRVDTSISSPYLFYYLLSHQGWKQIHGTITGSAQGGINRGFTGKVGVEYPPLEEQRKIASVLYTVDQVIQKTEEIIRRKRKIKTGLLHSLYTDGYRDHDDFQTERLVAKEFDFPTSWDLMQLRDLVESPIIDFGSFSSTKLVEYVDEGVAFLRSDMFSDEGIKDGEIKYIPEGVHDKLEKSHVYPGDILFTKIGVNLGKSTLYTGEYGICNSNATVAKIRPDSDIINKRYLTYFLQSFVCEAQYRPKVVGTPPRINLGDIRDLIVPIPSTDEQVEIADSIESVEKGVNIDKERVDVLGRLIVIRSNPYR